MGGQGEERHQHQERHPGQRVTSDRQAESQRWLLHVLATRRRAEPEQEPHGHQAQEERVVRRPAHEVDHHAGQTRQEPLGVRPDRASHGVMHQALFGADHAELHREPQGAEARCEREDPRALGQPAPTRRRHDEHEGAHAQSDQEHQGMGEEGQPQQEHEPHGAQPTATLREGSRHRDADEQQRQRDDVVEEPHRQRVVEHQREAQQHEPAAAIEGSGDRQAAQRHAHHVEAEHEPGERHGRQPRMQGLGEAHAHRVGGDPAAQIIGRAVGRARVVQAPSDVHQLDVAARVRAGEPVHGPERPNIQRREPGEECPEEQVEPVPAPPDRRGRSVVPERHARSMKARAPTDNVRTGESDRPPPARMSCAPSER